MQLRQIKLPTNITFNSLDHGLYYNTAFKFLKYETSYNVSNINAVKLHFYRNVCDLTTSSSEIHKEDDIAFSTARNVDEAVSLCANKIITLQPFRCMSYAGGPFMQCPPLLLTSTFL